MNLVTNMSKYEYDFLQLTDTSICHLTASLRMVETLDVRGIKQVFQFTVLITKSESRDHFKMKRKSLLISLIYQKIINLQCLPFHILFMYR